MYLVLKRNVKFIIHLFTVLYSTAGTNSWPHKATI